jgi:hypothetical protein
MFCLYLSFRALFQLCHRTAKPSTLLIHNHLCRAQTTPTTQESSLTLQSSLVGFLFSACLFKAYNYPFNSSSLWRCLSRSNFCCLPRSNRCCLSFTSWCCLPRTYCRRLSRPNRCPIRCLCCLPLNISSSELNIDECI